MSVIARLYVKSKSFAFTDAEIGEMDTVVLAGVNACMDPTQGPPDAPPPEPEDSIYGKYTPSADLSLTMVKGAADQFEVGAKYSATFERI